MLAVTSYPRDYVDGCRAAMDAQLAAYAAVAEAAGSADAVNAFEPLCFNNMVLALDQWFLHRQRSLEGKDGNPLNEVRVLCTSITQHGAKLTPDKTIKLKAATSVLGYEPGDPIALSATDFAALSAAFLDELERRYPEK